MNAITKPHTRGVAIVASIAATHIRQRVCAASLATAGTAGWLAAVARRHGTTASSAPRSKPIALG